MGKAVLLMMSDGPNSVQRQGVTEAQGKQRIEANAVFPGHVVERSTVETVPNAKEWMVGSALYEFFKSMFERFVALFERSAVVESTVVAKEKSALSNFAKRDSDVGEMLLELVDFSRGGKKIAELNLKDLGIEELKIVQANIVKLKDVGGIDALELAGRQYSFMAADENLGQEGKDFFRKVGGRYSNAINLLNKVQKEVEEKLTLHRYSFEKEKSFNEREVNKESITEWAERLKSLKFFSQEFNEGLFTIYSGDLLNESESMPMEVNGVNMGICRHSWIDFQRFNIELEDENGSRPLFDMEKEPYPSDPEEQVKWKQRQIGKLLEFCGGDKDAVMKLSQLYLNQSLGNGHNEVINGELTNQKLVGGRRDGHSFSVKGGGSEMKKFTKVIKENGKIVGIEYRVEGKVGEILDQTDMEPLNVDKESSPYFLSVQLTLDKNLELASADSVNGVVDYNINYDKSKAMLGSLFKDVTEKYKEVDGSFKGKFSEGFSKGIFKRYMDTPQGEGETKGWMMNTGAVNVEDGKEVMKRMPVCEQVGIDLHRMSFRTVDKRGIETDFSFKDFPVFEEKEKKELEESLRKTGKSEGEIKAAVEVKEREIKKERAECSEKRIAAFLKLCGYDPEATYLNDQARALAKGVAEEKLFKLSQFMSQTLASGFELEHMLGEKSLSPQVLSNGERFNIDEASAKKDSYIVIKENLDESITLEVVTKFTDIKKIHRFEKYDEPEPAVPEGSHYEVRTGIILNSNGEWEEYKAGYLNFEVKLAPGEV